MNHRVLRMPLLGVDLFVSRTGYTGEDGFEISVPNTVIEKFVDIMLSHPEIKPIGLGARDSLRLESSLNLHGNDIDETTTPLEAGLMWNVRKRKDDDNKFYGQEALEEQIKRGATRKKIGFELLERGVLRHGMEIYNEEGEKVGYVTSGTMSPLL